MRDGVSFSKVEEDRYLVNYTDIQKLPNLSCYVTFPGDYPAVRMSMRYEKIKDCAEDLQMREINDSLDPEIESEISRREEEEGDITALLARLEQGEARKMANRTRQNFRLSRQNRPAALYQRQR